MEFIFLVPGFVMLVVGAIWFLMLAFRESPLWGIGCLICGIVQIIFLIKNIHETWKPFLIQIGGLVLIAIGSAIADPGM